MRLQDKVAVITGAASGFGEAFAHRFAAEGAKILGVDINRDGGESVAAAVRAEGGEMQFVRADVSQAGDVAEAIQAAVETFVARRRQSGEVRSSHPQSPSSYRPDTWPAARRPQEK